MTHKEQRIYLIRALLAEESRYQDISIPAEEREQKDLLREPDECAYAKGAQSKYF